MLSTRAEARNRRTRFGDARLTVRTGTGHGRRAHMPLRKRCVASETRINPAEIAGAIATGADRVFVQRLHTGGSLIDIARAPARAASTSF